MNNKTLMQKCRIFRSFLIALVVKLLYISPEILCRSFAMYVYKSDYLKL